MAISTKDQAQAPSVLIPTQDQIMGQIRLIIPALGTIATAVGIANADKVSSTVAALLQAAGPIAYVITVVWSLIANSRKSIMASAAKSVAPGVPVPQIVLPVQEEALAQALPGNVNTTETKKVVSQ